MGTKRGRFRQTLQRVFTCFLAVSLFLITSPFPSYSSVPRPSMLAPQVPYHHINGASEEDIRTVVSWELQAFFRALAAHHDLGSLPDRLSRGDMLPGFSPNDLRVIPSEETLGEGPRAQRFYLFTCFINDRCVVRFALPSDDIAAMIAGELDIPALVERLRPVTRVLIVEDMLAQRKLLMLSLVPKYNYESTRSCLDVTVVSTGEEAVNALRETNRDDTPHAPYDLVLSDYRFYEQGGSELTTGDHQTDENGVPVVHTGGELAQIVRMFAIRQPYIVIWTAGSVGSSEDVARRAIQEDMRQREGIFPAEKGADPAAVIDAYAHKGQSALPAAFAQLIDRPDIVSGITAHRRVAIADAQGESSEQVALGESAELAGPEEAVAAADDTSILTRLFQGRGTRRGVFRAAAAALGMTVLNGCGLILPNGINGAIGEIWNVRTPTNSELEALPDTNMRKIIWYRHGVKIGYPISGGDDFTQKDLEVMSRVLELYRSEEDGYDPEMSTGCERREKAPLLVGVDVIGYAAGHMPMPAAAVHQGPIKIIYLAYNRFGETYGEDDVTLLNHEIGHGIDYFIFRPQYPPDVQEAFDADYETVDNIPTREKFPSVFELWTYGREPFNKALVMALLGSPYELRSLLTAYRVLADHGVMYELDISYDETSGDFTIARNQIDYETDSSGRIISLYGIDLTGLLDNDTNLNVALPYLSYDGNRIFTDQVGDVYGLDDGRLLVQYSRGSVSVIDPYTGSKRSIQGQIEPAGTWSSPFVADPSGQYIYYSVGDGDYQRYFKVTPERTLVYGFAKITSEQIRAQFGIPLTESINQRIQSIDRDGNFIVSWYTYDDTSYYHGAFYVDREGNVTALPPEGTSPSGKVFAMGMADFALDGDILYIGNSPSREIYLYRLSTGAIERTISYTGDHSITGMLLNPDGTQLTLAKYDGTIVQIDIGTGMTIAELGSPVDPLYRPIDMVRMSLDGVRVIMPFRADDKYLSRVADLNAGVIREIRDIDALAPRRVSLFPSDGEFDMLVSTSSVLQGREVFIITNEKNLYTFAAKLASYGIVPPADAASASVTSRTLPFGQVPGHPERTGYWTKDATSENVRACASAIEDIQRSYLLPIFRAQEGYTMAGEPVIAFGSAGAVNAKALHEAVKDDVIVDEAFLDRVIRGLQKYYRLYGPDDIGTYHVEFRRNMMIPAQFDHVSRTIILDVDLLKLPPEQILTVLAFVIGHEGMHRYRDDEEAVTQIDLQRLGAWSDDRADTLIAAFAALGADEGYLRRLRDVRVAEVRGEEESSRAERVGEPEASVPDGAAVLGGIPAATPFDYEAIETLSQQLHENGGLL